MHLTTTSIITTCVLISLLAFLLVLLFRQEAVIKRIGPHCAIVILLAVVIRMFFPLEFNYTYSLRVEKILPEIREFIDYVFIKKPIELTLGKVFCIAWVLGIVISIILKIISYRKMIRFSVLFSGKGKQIPTDARVLELCPEMQKMKIVVCDAVQSPYLFGIKNPIMVVPNIEYSEQQLRYILLHEAMHIRNKDIIWKILIDILCSCFWWNPAFMLLKRELFRIIEMRNDITITKMLTDTEQVQYLECLRDTAVMIGTKDVAFGVGFSAKDAKALKNRMNLIANNKFNRTLQIFLTFLISICLFLTSAVIFEPYKLAPVSEETGSPLVVGNTYLVINGDMYDVYMDGKFVFTTDDLSPFSGVNIYHNLKEAEENEKKAGN